MKYLSFILRALLLLLLTLPLVLLLMAVDREPAVPELPPLSATEIDAVQQLLIDNDPRRLLAMEEQTLYLPEEDADTLIKYFFSQPTRFSDMRGRLDMELNQAELTLTRPLDLPLFDGYLNIRVGFSEQSDPVHISHISVGTLELPESVIPPLLDWLAERFADETNLRFLFSAYDTIESVSLQQDQVAVHVDLDETGITTLSQQTRDVLINPPEQERIGDYYQKIMEVEAEILASGRTRVSLGDLLRPLFLRGYENALEGIDPVRENRALLLALAAWLIDLDLDQVSSYGGSLPDIQPRQLIVTVHSRLDLAQHLITSAAISASTSASVAELITLYKEVHDSRYRSSGFSFDDLTASQVGTALGILSTEDHSSAHRIQHLLRSHNDEDFYMPAFTSQEALTEDDFNEEFGDRQSAAFQQRLQEINTSIAQRPLFSGFDTMAIFNSRPAPSL